jgi:surface antigen
MYVKDQNGNIGRITVIAGALPEGLQEITISEELQSEDLRFLEAVEVPAVEYVAPVEAQPEKWTKEGEDDSLTQPMTIEYWSKEGEEDILEDPEDETWTHHPSVADDTWTYVDAVEAVEEVLAVPAYWTVQKRADADDTKAQEATRAALVAARSFGDELITEFGAENIALGITADGMTKTVRQNMREITDALITGSLYDAIDEIDNFPEEDKDAKYITDARLQAYRDKITNFLGI